MKKLIMITGIILTVYLLLVTVVTQDAQAPEAVPVQSAATESGFQIGESEGRVAVFHNGDLYMRTDTLLSSLPKSDRTRLENGIDVDSLKELKMLLQDYCS